MSLDVRIGSELVKQSQAMFHGIVSDLDTPEPEDAYWIPYLVKFERVVIHTQSPVWRDDQDSEYVLTDLVDKGVFVEEYSSKTDELQKAFMIPWMQIQRLEFKDVTKNNLVTSPEFIDDIELP